MSNKYKKRRESSSDSEDSNMGRMFRKFIKRYRHHSSSSEEESGKENGGHKGRRRDRSKKRWDRKNRLSDSQGRSIATEISSRRDSAEFAESQNTEFINIINDENNHEIQEVTPQEGDPLEREEVSLATLPKDVLQVLGEDVTTQKTSEVIHVDIATRWDKLLKQGLDAEVRTTLMAKYPPISNCPLVEAPKLNREVKSSINELVLRRDTRLATIQNQIGACLGAIGSALTILVEQPEGRATNNIQIIEKISDAGRLLADIHQSETETRRVLVAANLNKTVRDTMVVVPRDEWLFGTNFAELVKETKALEKSSMELKSETQKQKYASTSTAKRYPVNYKGPSRQTPKSYRQGGPKYQAQKKSSQTSHNKKYQYKGDQKRRRY